jgi:hypothetical protein
MLMALLKRRGIRHRLTCQTAWNIHGIVSQHGRCHGEVVLALEQYRRPCGLSKSRPANVRRVQLVLS